MFLNPWYGGDPNPPSSNILGSATLQSSSPDPSKHHSPYNSPLPQRRLNLTEHNSPSSSPTLLPRNSHLHTHFGYLATPTGIQLLNTSSSSNTNTSSSSNNSSPVLIRNNNSSPAHSSPRINFNTFHPPPNGLHFNKNTFVSSSPFSSPALSRNNNSTPPTPKSSTLPLPLSKPPESSFTSSNEPPKPVPPRPVLGPPLKVLQKLLDELQMRLRPGWTVHCTTDGRYFYCNHSTGTSSWLPPLENWRNGQPSLPYGWEEASDKDGKTYFINHLNKTTTYSDPRKDDPLEDPPRPRTITLSRDPEMGFGFVAGSEKPVIVRFVTEGGPSETLLLPGDQVLEIDGEDVAKAPRDHVIQLVRSCKETITLTVTQPPLDNSSRKSALLSAAKKQRLKSNPSRVRFAESVHINGTASNTQPSPLSSAESTTPFMPNVLKVFLENGQTKSFKYDSSTTVGDVLESLHQKLGIKCPSYFSLVVEHVKSLRRNKLTILDPKETLTRIAARPGAQHLRCLYRVTFVPRDAYALLKKDTVAFEYLYHQCVNDVLQERFSPELKYDVALRLAALHIQQHAITNGVTGNKINVKNIEREFGLEKFVPSSLLENMKRKELRKLLGHFLKVQAGAAVTAGQKQVPALQPKLHYLKIIAELPSYGAKCFSGCVMTSTQESVILISPRFGISQISGMRNTMPEPLCDIDQITAVSVMKEDDNISLKVDIALKDPDKEKLCVTLEERDAEELVLVLQGYYSLLAEKILPVEHTQDHSHSDQAPPYHTKHRVLASGWSYASIDQGVKEHEEEKIVDLSVAPPYQKPPPGYKIPNGLIPGMNLNDSSINQQPNASMNLDSNMNKTNSVYDNTSEQGTLTRPVVASTSQESSSVTDDVTKAPIKSIFEARNSRSEVIKRVAQHSDHIASDSESMDVESIKSSGRLKHSDSLLLLTQGQKLVPGNEVPLRQASGSGSDTDSLTTPTHKNVAKTTSTHPEPQAAPANGNNNQQAEGVFSSFGLHSPDNLPTSVHQTQHSDIKTIIRQLEDKSGVPYAHAEESLYLDPDLIDLTFLPPPSTPDEDGPNKLLPVPQLSTPPTPFADRETLEKELQALERNSASMLTGPTIGDSSDSVSLSSLNTSVSSDTSTTSSMSSIRSNGGPGFTLAALKQLGMNSADDHDDIDSFIANLTIPPPPDANGSVSVPVEDIPKVPSGSSPYDLAAFIIPPPPESISNKRSSDIIKRLYEAKAGIVRVVGDDDQSADKDIYITEVRPPQRMSEESKTNTLPSGKVASLQKKFETTNHSSTMNIKKSLFTFDPPAQPSSVGVMSPGYDNLDKTEMEERLAKAFEENDKIFKSFGTVKQTEGATSTVQSDIEEGSSISVRIRNFNTNISQTINNRLPELPRQQSVPTSILNSKSDGKSPQSPSATANQSFNDCTTLDNSKINVVSMNVNGGIPKSSSHGDIVVHNSETSSTTKPVIISNGSNQSSSSTEDIRANNQLSPSKTNIASSYDSLTSSSSLATVKSASLKSLDEDPPPELPPRNANKNAMKPPLPRSASQELSRKVSPSKCNSSPSTRRKPTMSNGPSSPSSEVPPALPIRAKNSAMKPVPPPIPSPTKKINAKPPAPLPPDLPSKPPTDTSGSPLKNRNHTPQPLSIPTESLSNNFELVNREEKTIIHDTNSLRKSPNEVGGPLQTSSPRSQSKPRLPNGKLSLVGSELDDSLDSGSFDQDSLDESEDFEAMTPASKESFRKVTLIVSTAVKKLTKMAAVCTEAQTQGGNINKNEMEFQKAKEKLTSESRQFVTASKLFVKSATESEETLLQCLSNCLTLLQNMIQMADYVVQYTSTPLQTQNMVVKVRDVASAYHTTVRTALAASGRGLDHPSMTALMTHATNLAGVLTTLMRTLRVFSP